MVALRETADDGQSLAPQRFWLAHRRRTYIGLVIMILLWAWLLIAPPGEWAGYHDPLELILLMVAMFVWIFAVILVAPALLNAVVTRLRTYLYRRGGFTLRLAADNLQRNIPRLTLTALAFTIGVGMMIGTAGLISHQNDVLLGTISKNAVQEAGWFIYAFDRSSGVGQMSSFGNNDVSLDPAVIKAIYEIVGDRAEIGSIDLVAAAEISSPMLGFPSMLASVSEVERFRRPEVFNLLEGDHDEMVRLLLEPGCAITTSTAVAAKFNVKPGDTVSVTGLKGKVDCVIAGLGAYGITPVSWISPGARDFFVPVGRTPNTITIHPRPDTDRAALEADLRKLEQRFPDKAFVSAADQETRAITDTSDQLMIVFNGMVFLGIIAAAFGMLNTIMVSILERQKEIGLLRAVGATRKQIVTILVFESLLVGLLGALLGTVTGLGIAALCPLTEGGIAWSLPNLDLRAAAVFVLWPAFRNGWWALIVAPLIAGAVAWPVARSAVRGAAVDALQPERRETLSVKSIGGVFARGSLRVRFAVGTGVLLSLILIGLVSAVTYHARVRIEAQLLDGMRQMVQWSAGMLELGLPENATMLNLDIVNQSDSPFMFDSTMLLRFEALMDEMTRNGLLDFSVTDKDNIILISLDEKRLGDQLATPGSSSVEAHSVNENGTWTMTASAPVRNKNGDVLSFVRVSAEPDVLENMLNNLRDVLMAIGLGIVALGVLISVFIVTPLVQATRKLSEHAAEVRNGTYTSFDTTWPARGWFGLALGTRLTIALIGSVIGLVAALAVVAIPVQKTYVEGITKDTLRAAVDWMGAAASTSLGVSDSGLDISNVSFEQLTALTPMLDLARIQELSYANRNKVAYLALIDKTGKVVFSDQMALVGETLSVPSETTITDSTWREATVWMIATPLRRGRDGEIVGALAFAARREQLDTFLAESRSLFNLTGIIAVLAGILLAQAIGGAVAAPARTLSAGARRVAEGDLTTRFNIRTNDELSILADAYNRMVTGLQEREWLRDMFGRFVSQEVAEAIRTGQVKLEGENRVVSVLFCDIRDFTARSERHTPQEIVALLNEYLPVVVSAAQQHQGTVNKFGGDSTLIIYGAPGDVQESAYCAVQTALGIREGLSQLNEHLAERGEQPIRIGVGINTGLVLAGAVGPHERQEYTVIGDSVNLASRIEALNKKYPEHGILISQWTYEALGKRRAEFELVSLGKMEIRGKSEDVEVWSVVR